MTARPDVLALDDDHFDTTLDELVSFYAHAALVEAELVQAQNKAARELLARAVAEGRGR